MSTTGVMLIVLVALAATAITFGGSGALAAMTRVPSGPLAAEALDGDADLMEVAVRCFTRRHRVGPPPCFGGPRHCPKGPRRCYYWSERVCQGKRSSFAPR
jgi:hypothetical protein